jgi:hypothetical protein
MKMARSSPKVWVFSGGGEMRGEVKIGGEGGRTIRLDSVAWREWLEAPSTVGFAYPVYDRTQGYIRGSLSVRKERRARGGEYWVAYHRIGIRVRKIYLGRAERVRQEALAAAAARFEAMEVPAASEAAEANEQKEVRKGQLGGASLEGEVMARRIKNCSRVVQFGRR